MQFVRPRHLVAVQHAPLRVMRVQAVWVKEGRRACTNAATPPADMVGTLACMPMRAGACPACASVRRTLAPRLRCNSTTHNRHRSGVPAMPPHADGIAWPLLSPVRLVLSRSFRPFAPSSAPGFGEVRQRAEFTSECAYRDCITRQLERIAAVLQLLHTTMTRRHSLQSHRCAHKATGNLSARCICCSGNPLWTNGCGNFEMPVTAAQLLSTRHACPWHHAMFI